MKIPTAKVTRVEIQHTLAGSMVRTHREEAGISLRELARRMLIAAPYLSDLERGRRNWTKHLFDLAIAETKNTPKKS